MNFNHRMCIVDIKNNNNAILKSTANFRIDKNQEKTSNINGFLLHLKHKARKAFTVQGKREVRDLLRVSKSPNRFEKYLC